MGMRALATKLPSEVTSALDAVCRKLGLRKNHVIETAIREKLEDLLDAKDLREAIREASGFHHWRGVKREPQRTNRK